MVKRNNKTLKGGDKTQNEHSNIQPKIKYLQEPLSTSFEYDEVLKEENTSIPSSKTQFQFTRHLLSCNNISEGKGYSIGKDFEPGATVYGIFETIQYAQNPDQTPYFHFNHVYVSNLYRTWITAFLLYGTNLTSKDTLNLYVSPYLKEFHKTTMGFSMKRGNFPKEIHHIGAKFLKFLNTLKDYSNNPTTSIHVPLKWFQNLPNMVVLHLPPVNEVEQKIIYTKDETGAYKSDDFCNVKDSAGPNSGEEFTTTGNLQKFMEWYNSNFNYYGNHEQENKVHVVTHSHIMRDYLTKFQTILQNKDDPFEKYNVPFDLDKIQDETIEKIRNSNSWHFITDVNKTLELTNIDATIKAFDLTPGVEIKKDKAKNLEETYKNYSLCGKMGSINSQQICQNKGGKNTRKKRRCKTKKLSKRVHYKTRKQYK